MRTRADAAGHGSAFNHNQYAETAAVAAMSDFLRFNVVTNEVSIRWQSKSNEQLVAQLRAAMKRIDDQQANPIGYGRR